jgi:transposase
MTLKRRQFTKEFKLQVIREIEAGKSVAQAAREHQLHPNTIIKWRKLHQQYAERAFADNGQTYKDEARIAELERMVGQLAMGNALLKKPWRGSKLTASHRAPMEARSERHD